jgi:hypothetical protein
VVLTDGTLLVTDNATLGSFLTVTGAGTLTIDGTVETYGGSISASANSRVEIGTLDGASGGITLSADGTSAIEIGTAGTASTATITIDGGVTVTESGSSRRRASSSMARRTSRTLTLDATGRGLSGSGSLQIGQGSSLVVDGVDPGPSDKVSIDFAGSGGSLWLASNDFNSLAQLIPAISGFNATDVIEHQGAATSAQNSGGVLSWYDGTTLVATLTIGSGYSNQFLTLSVDNGAYTQIDCLGGGRTRRPRALRTRTGINGSARSPASGTRRRTGNDVTTGQNPAAVAPGAQDLVTIGAASNGAAQAIVGDGSAYGLTIDDETLLEGTFNIGEDGLIATGGPVVLYEGSGLTDAGGATFDAFSGLTLDGASMSVSARRDVRCLHLGDARRRVYVGLR